MLWHADDGEHQAMQAVHDFEFPGQRMFFVDFWDHDFSEWTVHYLWRCYAIVWAIRQYDSMKAVPRV